MTGPKESEATQQDQPAVFTDPADSAALTTRDHWLDEVSAPAQPAFGQVTSLAMSTFAGPARWLRRFYYFVSTTPGKLFTVTVVLTIAIAAAGIAMSNSSAARQGDLDVLLSSTEPMSNSAHNLYTSLSLADTIATTGFVQAGVESDAMRQKYNEAIDKASIAATESLMGSSESDQRIQELVATIQRQLPVYTAMVETARANHRAGNAVAAAYMSNASALMRNDILPAASELFRLSSDKVSQQQKQLTTPQWVPISGLVAAVVFLLIAQWWLWRLTRRRLNKGFVTATGLLIVAIFWVGISNLATWTAGSQGFESSAGPWSMLTNARIEAQQTRTGETLALVRRQSEVSALAPFDDTTAAIRKGLDEYSSSAAINKMPSEDRATMVDDANSAINTWSYAHAQFMRSLRDGDYDNAVRLATATDDADSTPAVTAADANKEASTKAADNADNADTVTSASAFNTLDGILAKLIADARMAMRASIQDSLAATTAVSTAVLLLTIASIISVVLGIRPRVQEYL